METIVATLLSRWLWPVGRRVTNAAATTAIVANADFNVLDIAAHADNPIVAIAIAAVQIADMMAAREAHRYHQRRGTYNEGGQY